MLFYLKAFLSVAKKIIIIAAVLVGVLTLFSHFIAEDKPKQSYDMIKGNREEIYKFVNNPLFKETTDGKVALIVYRAFFCGFIGEACTDNPNDAEKNYKKSLMGTVGNFLSVPYSNPPASGVYWAAAGLEKAGFIPQTYAAEGIGFAGIKPFMNIWKIFRDVAYMLLVIFTIVVGFMIMFRRKVNQQTVISVENALPRIVVSLILITFSFAIAGFLIDLMYVVIAVMISLLSNKDTYYKAAEYQDVYLTATPHRLFYGIFPVGLETFFYVGNSFLNMLPAWLNIFIRILSGAATVYITASINPLLKPITDAFSGVSGAGFSLGKLPGILPHIAIATGLALLLGTIMPQIIVMALFSFTLLFLFFRVFFILLRAYIQILIYIILGPLFLLFEVLPSKNAFAFWFKSLFVEIMTFPIVITVFIIGSNIIHELSAKGKPWTPPFLTNIDSNAFTVLVGMGLILVIPELIKMFKELLGVKGAPVGLSFGAFFAGAGSGVGAGMGIMQQYSSLMYASHYLPKGIKEGLRNILPWFKDVEKSTQDVGTPPPGVGGGGKPHGG